MVKAKITLDPGHGGNDPGAVGPSGTKEKDIALSVARLIPKFLPDGVKAVFTRTQDVDISLEERTKIANDAKAACCVSIHCNGYKNPKPHGTETWHYPNSERGERLANALQSRLVTMLGLVDRGVKQAGFYVLKHTQMPAALVELAFITNPEEEQLLVRDDFQEQAARAVALGISDYLEFNAAPDRPDPWATIPWQKAAAQGVLDGTRPRDPVSREELVVVLDRLGLLDGK